MTHMTSHPGQQLLVESLWRLLCQPIAVILQHLEGHNHGPVGLDYQCTGDSSAQRSGFPFHCYTYLVNVVMSEFKKILIIFCITSYGCRITNDTLEGTSIIFTTHKRSLGQGNVFTPVCHSVHRGSLSGRGSLSRGSLSRRQTFC